MRDDPPHGHTDGEAPTIASAKVAAAEVGENEPPTAAAIATL